MTINIDDNLLGIWFMEVSSSQDWMAGLSKTNTPGELIIQYRHRYYKDRKAHGSADEKSWYQGTLADTSIEIGIEQVRLIVRYLSEHAVGDPYELLRGDKSIETFISEFQALPFTHFIFEQSKEGG